MGKIFARVDLVSQEQWLGSFKLELLNRNLPGSHKLKE
jgi:hypothetical protein